MRGRGWSAHRGTHRAHWIAGRGAVFCSWGNREETAELINIPQLSKRPACARDAIVFGQLACLDAFGDLFERRKLLPRTARKLHDPRSAAPICSGTRAGTCGRLRLGGLKHLEQVPTTCALDRGAPSRNKGFLKFVVRVAAVAGDFHVLAEWRFLVDCGRLCRSLLCCHKVV